MPNKGTVEPSRKKSRSYRKKEVEWDELSLPNTHSYFPFDILPVEIQIIIFSYLDLFELIKRTCLVSKKYVTLSVSYFEL